MTTYLDGRWVNDEQATVNVRSRALNYGLGVFAGIRGYLAEDGRQVLVFRLADHVRRLERSARLIQLELPGGREKAADLILELLRRDAVHQDCYVRPLVIHDAAKLAPILEPGGGNLVIYWLPMGSYLGKEAIDVCTSSWRRVGDSAIPARAKPTGGYLNSALARREAMDNGFDEAIFLTEAGRVSEGTGEHVFIVRDGVLHSPPSIEDNLDGITRRSLIALASEDLALPFVERPIGRTELYVADEVFLCGTAAEVTAVRSVDRRIVGDGGMGPITRRLRERFMDVVRGRVKARGDWLTPVWG